MPVQRIPIAGENVDVAAEGIIGFLGRQRQMGVIYLDGWGDSGVGASAILKEVVKRLSMDATREEIGIEKVVHIDCSLWQSKRSLQKAIAEELKLPQEVMAFFDHNDEEDDFDGVQQAARGVIPHVKSAILDELNNCKFLVVFHNGSGDYVDLWECGVPVIGVMSKRVLWTSRGRFLFHGIQNKHLEDVAGLSDGIIVILPSIEFLRLNAVNENHDALLNDILWRFLLAEAEEVARYCGIPELNTKIVLECILYMVLRLEEDCGINWGTHAANYWVCDGIILDANHCGRSAWEIGDALHRNMNLDWPEDMVQTIRKLLCDKQQWRHSDRWVSATGQDTVAVPVPTSIFWTGSMIEGDMFEHFNGSRLGVLHLSNCTFSFSSPPFLSCSNLRFLLLDHCEDENDTPDCGEVQDCSEHGDGACFQKLWVLELSFTDWYWLLSEKMLDLMVELRELNVEGLSNWSISHLHGCSDAGSNRHRPLKLRVVGGSKDNDNIGDSSGHTKQQASSFPDLSSWYILKTVILDGCGELEEIGCNTLPPSLESFSFTSDLATKINSISFRRCAILKSLLLRGLFGELVELDMSGTSVKTLDLSETQALHLKRLFLLGCEKLRAILWPQEEGEETKLEVLHIDTTRAAWAMEGESNKQEATSDSTSAESSSMVVHGNGQVPTNLALYISLRDPRLFRSLLHMKLIKYLHIEITSTGNHKGSSQGVNNVASGGSKQEVRAVNFQNSAGNLYIEDIISTFEDNSQTVGANEDIVFIDAPTIKWMWPCPPIPMHNWARCYISIQDETLTQSLQDTIDTRQQTSITLPSFVHENAKILHLHDSFSITSIPGPSIVDELVFHWDELQWCQLERCPNLEGSVFSPSTGEFDYFYSLKTFWASQLLKARYIWDWSETFFYPGRGSFRNLVFLHLDCCPRLVHVLPLYTLNLYGCRSLEILEIVCCGELREVFPSDSESQQQQKPRKFPSLKRIHLYELPMLQRICGRRMLAPRLETVRIRGCWSLKRLPAVCSAPHRSIESDEEEEIPGFSPPLFRDYFRAKLRLKSEPHKLPIVDCEKEWWDGLEWDGLEAGHHPSHYKPTHSAYYKKTLLRATVLR